MPFFCVQILHYTKCLFFYYLDFTGQLQITGDISRFTVTVGRFHDLQKSTSFDLCLAHICFSNRGGHLFSTSRCSCNKILSRDTAYKFRRISINTMRPYSHVYPEVETLPLTFHRSQRKCVLCTRISSLR